MCICTNSVKKHVQAKSPSLQHQFRASSAEPGSCQENFKDEALRSGVLLGKASYHYSLYYAVNIYVYITCQAIAVDSSSITSPAGMRCCD